MMRSDLSLPEVFSADELARAAGVPVRRVRELIAAGEIRTVAAFSRAAAADGDLGEFIPHAEAVRAGRALANGLIVTAAVHAGAPSTGDRELFSRPASARRATGLPLALSSTLHAGMIVGALFVTTIGLAPTAADSTNAVEEPQKLRLIYLALPGPGDGGGGGGMRQPAPPPKAMRKGPSRISSPLPARVPPRPIVPVEKPVDPKPEVLKAEQLPPIVAPIVVAPADSRDRIGVLEQTTAQADSRGPGTGSGVGSGAGTGIGEGQGSGVGPGSGGGTGGGPYRPGSGIEPPRLLREVKPDYTEEARRQGLEGEVVLEIVVRRDGTVGDVRLLQGLGAGLNERAVQAVRQWRFAPARRLNAPVDVLVEVAVEFRLR
jgi:TonB family protein